MLRWHRDKREFYRSLWACAEDSCCIIDDMFEVKLTAWASPLDADMTVGRMEEWRDELIECGKLVPYEAEGRRYLFIPTMAEHERPRNPQSPDWPLPPWVKCTVAGDGKSRRCTYDFQYRKGSVQNECGNRNGSPALPCPALPCPDLSSSGDDEGETPEQREATRFHAVVGVWESVIGSVPSQVTKRTLRSWVTMGYSDPAIESALKVAVEQGAKSPAQYATSVLRNGVQQKAAAQDPYDDLGRVF